MICLVRVPVAANIAKPVGRTNAMNTNPFLAALCVAAGLLPSQAGENGVPQLATANNTFAFRLVRQLCADAPRANLFVSPYSAATALQMAASGAAGQTKQEMEEVLATAGISSAALSEASQTITSLLNAPDKSVTLATANALWYRQGPEIRPDFLVANQRNYQSTIRPLNFSDQPGAEAAINQWASEQTHGRITQIANGMVDPVNTDLVLANAVYFKGKWLDPFDAKLTREGLFHQAAGGRQNVPMMELSKTFTYRKGSGYQAVRLPYVGGDLAMYVFLPDSGSNPARLLQIMNGDTWRRVTVPGFSERPGHLVLPRFKISRTLDLVPPLKALGMKRAFTDRAELSGMFRDPHQISKVRQQAFVDVAEEGTEAAAVTVLTVDAASARVPDPVKPFEMIVDRPFLFAIVDARSGMILFLGVVNDL